jgi:nucleotide-binding universal stress UspA family protein
MALRSVLVAYDGTKPAMAALDQAVEIAERNSAKMTVACVIPVIAAAYGIEMPPGASVVETIDAARRMLAEVKADVTKRGVSTVETVLLEGDPVDQILEYAERHPPDLIVVGSRGLSDAGRFFLGSVSDGILHHAHSSVLIVKSPTAAAPPRRSRAM